MLVLSRRNHEKVVFPDLQIVVQVLEIKGDRVRLGFEAPASVTILRGELMTAPANEPVPAGGDSLADSREKASFSPHDACAAL